MLADSDTTLDVDARLGKPRHDWAWADAAPKSERLLIAMARKCKEDIGLIPRRSGGDKADEE